MPVVSIIPCLDVNHGRVVKGIKFVDLQDVGDPVGAAAAYDKQGADELVFLDISATTEGRGMMADLAKEVALRCTIPLTVGGGIRDLETMRGLLGAGAAKVAVNSAAVADPDLISAAAQEFGSDRLTVAIDVVNSRPGHWEVVTHSGNKRTGRDAVEWAREMERRGAGALLPTSMDADGSQGGYDCELTAAIADAVQIPVIASGGAGSLEDMLEAVQRGHASAILAASVFHFGKITVSQVKDFLRQHGIEVAPDRAWS